MATITPGGNGSGATSSSVATIAGLSFGTATDRTAVAVAIMNSSNAYASGVTIGGTAASMAVQEVNTSPAPDMRCEVWYANAVAGASGSVVVTLASGDGDVSVQAYGLYDVSSAPTDSDSLVGSGASIALTALTVPAGGVGIACWVSNLTTATTWTGASEDYEATVGGDRHSAASITADGTNTITSDGATGQQVIAGAAWGIAERLADASLTQAGNTVTATGTVETFGAASLTQAANTVTGVYNTAGETLADAALTQAANTVTSAVTVDVAAAAAITQAAQTTTAAGTVETFAAAAITQGAQTTTAAATVDVVSAASLTQAANTLSAVYTVNTSAVVDVTQAANTVTATYFSGSFAEVALTQAANTITATATVLGQAASSMSQAANTIGATATVLVQCYASLTQAAHTMGTGLVERVLRGFGRATISGGIANRHESTGGQLNKASMSSRKPRAY